MILRFATVEDTEAIATLHAESWRTSYRGMLRDEYLDKDVFQDRKDLWMSRLFSPAENQCIILAEEDDELCGFICAFGNDDPRWGTLIDNLHVRQDRKGLGIGKALIAE
ncbi:MAG: GNAT family N-acetyltransferase [Leptonema illini]|jgi:GNAT superfamily N-acetyltransferase|uniref:GNAT family N-acetyltransferase n=1 Tax=Leptonema illini TaxID=183 RepID=A0A833H1Y1_9LEPT|nr:MAG: GNAT family N-acetyltransferase [Leptonema illini]PKL34480.1 MAG: hypothetical protein CVV45_02940 [Spirochaetae bacterium HGW-Spirochaetae-10]